MIGFLRKATSKCANKKKHNRWFYVKECDEIDLQDYFNPNLSLIEKTKF